MIATERFTLPNGLRVVHNYDASTAMVAVDVLYDVGARDEDPSLRGLAHLFEHLMFGGSAHIPEFDTALEHAGGQSNAWTSDDFTNFYIYLPARNIATAFWLESDRMLSLAFSQKSLEVQQSVVIEEFKQQCLNRPYGDMMHHLRSIAYDAAHPYSVPVIGRQPADIARVTLDDIRRFFFSHYAPNNAILAVSGNVTADEVRELAYRWFADIPRREIAPRLYGAPRRPAAPVEKIVTGAVPATEITVAYGMDAYGTDGYFTADLITDLLANGPSSRFYRQLLLGTDIFTSVDASITGNEHPGMLLLTGRLRDNGPDAECRAIEAINSVTAQLASTPPSAYELTRAINRMDSARTFGNISCVNKAQELVLAEYHGEDINAVSDRYRRITPEALSATASTIFSSAPATVIYRPE